MIGPRVAEADLSHRCEVVAGDIFDSVPPAADLYVIKHVLHDWSDERATAILQTIRRAIPPTGRLLVVEAVVRPGDAHDMVVKWRDVYENVCLADGSEPTEPEWQSLFTAAGFKITRIIPGVLSDSEIIEAAPA